MVVRVVGTMVVVSVLVGRARNDVGGDASASDN